MEKRDGIIKSVIGVTFLSLLGKLTGFFRETVVAAYYGGGGAADAYFLAHSLPSILFSVIGAGMGLVFVPMYIERLARDPEGGRSFASNILGMTLFIGIIVSILGIGLSKPVIELIGPRLGAKEKEIAVGLTRIMFPMFLFISLSFIMTGILQSHGSFLIPAMVSIPSNIIIVLWVVLFSNKYGIYALGFGALLGAMAQSGVQLPFMRSRLRPKLKIDIRDPDILTFGKLIIPMVLGSAIDRINILVDNGLASSLGMGSISAINYSVKLIDFSEGLTIGAILTVLYPKFAAMDVRGDHENLAQSVGEAIVNITRLVLPITAIFLVLGPEIVKLVFERGAFGDSETLATSYALSYYALGIWGSGVRNILGRLFYSMGDTKTPMVVSLWVLISNICLNLLLIGPMGVGGLGLATSISATFGTGILLYLAGRKIKGLNTGEILKDGYRTVLVTSLMAWSMVLLKGNVGGLYPYIPIGLGLIAGLIIYLVSYRFLGIDLPLSLKRIKKYYDISITPGEGCADYGPVSVIIPCYRCSGTIERAVASVWKQTLRPREVILVEDCSDDGGKTGGKIRQLKNTYPPNWIKAIYLDSNGGPGNARNIGWNIAAQKYIGFLDADDAWHPQKVEIQLRVMESIPHISIVGHDYELIKGKTNERLTLFTYEYYKGIRVMDLGKARMLLANRLYTSSVMLKRRWIEERFPVHKYYSEDYHLWLNILMAGHRAIRIEMPLYYVYEESMGEGLSIKLWNMEKGEIDTYLTLYRNKHIGPLTLIGLCSLSLIKYVKRLILSKFSNDI